MSETSRSRVCLDANLLIKLAVDEENSDTVHHLWRQWTEDDAEICAPSLIWYEVTSTLRKRVYRATMIDDEARSALEVLLGLGVSALSSEELHRTALAIANDLRQPAAYDAHYLAVAVELDCPFWTADEPLYNAAKDIFPRVRLLASA